MSKDNQCLSSFPTVGFVRLPKILEVILVCRSTWWKGVADGRYPKPTRSLGLRITCWKAEDILNLIEQASSSSGGEA